MQNIKNLVNKLYYSRNQTPQHQRDIVADLSRRGFLQGLMQIVVAGSASTLCCRNSFASSVGLPDLGDPDRGSLSPEEANLLGQQVILDIGNQGAMVEDYDVFTYVNEFGNNLASYSALAGSDFNFYLLSDRQINAFALPGGYICLHNGLIFYTMSEAELSSVVSHEIGHVVQHHIFRNIGMSNRNQWMTVAGIIAGALLAPLNPAAAMLAIQAAPGLAQQNALSFSRDYEREADRVGQQIMYSAGFDPEAMPMFFGRMQDASHFNGNDMFAFLQTHPVTLERLSEAEARANQMGHKMRPDSIDFLLTREKCRIRQIDVKASILFYTSALKTGRYASLNAQYYGLSLAYMMKGQLSESKNTLDKIKDVHYLNHPFVLGLRGKQLFASQNYTLTDKFYDKVLEQYPNHKGLWMGQIDFLTKVKNYPKLITRLDQLSSKVPNDLDLWDRQIALYADGSALANPLKYRYAFANELYYMGAYRDAIEQYQLTLDLVQKSNDGSLVEIIMARMSDARHKFNVIQGIKT